MSSKRLASESMRTKVCRAMENARPQVPAVSVITATYRDPKGLAATIDSLRPLISSGMAWEHILVDSSPTENEPVISLLKDDWPLIRIERAPDGIYAAQNAGIQKSRGDAIWFLNGGDRLKDPAVLLAAIQALSSASGPCVAIAGADLMRNGIYLYSKAPCRNWTIGLVGANRICHQSVVYPRAVISRSGNFSTIYRLASDYEHHLRLMMAGVSIHRIGGTLVEYDMGGSSSNYREVFREYAAVHRELGPLLSFRWRTGNAAFRVAELFRITLLKTLSASPLAVILRPLWLAWNRGKARLGD